MKSWRGIAAATAIFLGLAACSGDAGQDAAQRPDGPALEARPAEAPRAETPLPSQFEFLRYRISTEGQSPRACLVFSRPLDPGADYSAYVAFADGYPAALEVSGQTLCLGGFDFGQSQTLTLRAGLPQAEGEGLAAEEVFQLEFGERPAFVGLVGDGVILPRLEADGLAVQTVNVETVSIRLSRVNDRALAFRSISSGYTAGEGDYGWLSSEESIRGVGELVWEGEMDTPGPANAAAVTVFPLAETIGVLEPGAYFIEIEDAKEIAEQYREPARLKRWLIITDLALTAYRGADGLDISVRSLLTARPVRGVRVDLIAASNEILASARSDSEGRLRFDGPLTRGDGAMAPRLLAAYGPDNDFALIDLNRSPVDLTGQDVDGRVMPDGADAYLYTDRGIYRPGETVFLNALLRDETGRAVTDRSGAIHVYAPNGIEAFVTRFDGAPEAGAVALDFDLPRSAARGEWRFEIRLDGAGGIGQQRVSVEDFVPQRIALDLEADDETPMRAGETRPVEASVRFLYGAPGAGLPVEGRLRIERDPAPFRQHEGFRWGKHDESFREIRRDLPDAVADGSGQALIGLAPGDAGSGSSLPLRLRAVVSAIEPGGRAVSDDVRIPYRPRALYLGVKPDFEGRARRNAPIGFHLAAVDREGAPQSAEVSWSLIRVDYDYDWYRSENGQWRWRRSRNVVEIEQGALTLNEDLSAQISFDGLDWGDYRLSVTDPVTGAETSHGFWVGWGSRPSNGVEAPDRVRIAGPSEPVAVGEIAEFTLLPPYAGTAEIVVATDRVIETRSLEIPEEGAALALEVSEDWGAGAYLMVNVFTPRDPVARPRPRRAVGVRHVPVDMGDRTIELTMDAPDLARPRQALPITLQAGDARRNESVYLTVAAVDEGILALTRFQSPDPTAHYYGQYRLGVDLLDDYGRLLDPNQGAAAAVRQGGDQLGGAGLSVVPTQTVALYSGRVDFNRDGEAQITLDLPDFNGELRLMAVAWSDERIGAAAQPMTVRDAVPAEIILPRFLAPGDSAQAVVTIDNVEGGPGRFSASVAAEGPARADQSLTLDLEAGQRADERVAIAGAEVGVARIGLAVETPSGDQISRDYPIEVRPAYAPSSSVERLRLAPGESYTPDPALLAGYAPGSGALSLTFAPTPLDSAALLRSLDRYPYGCTEQITSRALPLLYASDLAAAGGLPELEGARLTIQEAVSTLLNRQGSDGAIGLWRLGDRGASPWIGAYAVDFLSRAKAEGYVVPDMALERAYEGLTHISTQELWRASGYDDDIYRWRGQTDTPQRLADRSAAYALYVLARAGRADRSRLRYLHDERLQAMESPLARAHLGAALALSGDRARSRSAFEAAEAALGYDNPGDWYQSAGRDLAGVAALAAEAGEEALVERLTEALTNGLPEPESLTTQEKAFLLLAASSLSDGQDMISLAAEGLDMGGRNDAVLDAAGLSDPPRFTNAGQGPVYLTQVARGSPVEAPGAVAEGLGVTKRLRALDGSIVDPAQLRQGDRIVVQLMLRPGGERRVPAVLVDYLPAGFEIEAVVTAAEGGPNGIYSWLGRLSSPRVAEVRDDRFVAAIDLTRGESANLAYLVRAVTPGDYALPGAVAEDMYRPDVFARSASRRVRIAAE